MAHCAVKTERNMNKTNFKAKTVQVKTHDNNEDLHLYRDAGTANG